MSTQTNTDLPDLTMYRQVHHAIRTTARLLAVVAPMVSPTDRARVDALRRYWAGFTGEIIAHHTLEDDVFFPALAERSSRMVELTGRLEDDHQSLDEMMDQATQEIAWLDRFGAPDRAAHALAHIASHLDEHLGLEDEDVLPLFERHFSGAEYMNLEQRALKSVGVGKQALFTVPFLVSSVPEPTRSEMLSAAPLPIRLVHRVGKRGYARLERAVFDGIAGPVTDDRELVVTR